jgi:hypothetical protein
MGLSATERCCGSRPWDRMSLSATGALLRALFQEGPPLCC